MPSHEPTDAPGPAADRPRVLVVDPHEQTRRLLGQFLTDEGCEVVGSVPNYAQAIVGARTTRPTVIVTEVDGGAVLSPPLYVASLRRHSPAPVIVHSTSVPGAAEIRAWGLWGTVVKGDAPARLLAMVRDAHAAATAPR